MSVAAITTTAPAPLPSQLEVSDAVNSADLDKLRSLLQSTVSQTVNPPGLGSAVDEVASSSAVARTFGDSIIEGMLRFSSNHQEAMRTIESRLEKVAGNEAAGLNNFSEVLALQIDVSKWSMSVTGVDNASKAAANTVKELSRGG